MHISNHLTELLSEAAHRHYMDAFRAIYRTRLVEPVVVLFLFLASSGMALLWGHTRQRADWFRTVQIASGTYLIFFVLGHMNSVSVYASTFANIPTDWNFAAGAPTGLVNDAWNIRLVPHYLLGVFFVLTHLVSGTRIVTIAHGIDCIRADRMASSGHRSHCSARTEAFSIAASYTGIQAISQEADGEEMHCTGGAGDDARRTDLYRAVSNFLLEK